MDDNAKVWREVFLPVPVSKIAKNDFAALQHDFRLWRGIVKAKEYGLDPTPVGLFDGDGDLVFALEPQGFALCRLYHKDGCKDCPLFQAIQQRCFSRRKNEFYQGVMGGRDSVLRMIERLYHHAYDMKFPGKGVGRKKSPSLLAEQDGDGRGENKCRSDFGRATRSFAAGSRACGTDEPNGSLCQQPTERKQ